MNFWPKQNRTKIAKIITIAIIVLYLFTPIYISSHLNHMMRDYNMHMANDCMYTNTTEALCPMDLFNNINSWFQASLNTLPKIKILLVLFVASFTFTILMRRFVIFKRKTREKTFNFYLNLFSRGILNSKAY